MFKLFVLFALFTGGIIATAAAQNLTYKKVTDGDLAYVLNNLEKQIQFENTAGDLFINVYVVSDPSGSAHIEGTEEVTSTIYIAVSEDGELPEQNLFRLTSVYDPKIISPAKKARFPQLVFTYGAADKRKKAIISITLKSLQIKQVALIPKSPAAH
jgi:hypothetical protein